MFLFCNYLLQWSLVFNRLCLHLDPLEGITTFKFVDVNCTMKQTLDVYKVMHPFSDWMLQRKGDRALLYACSETTIVSLIHSVWGLPAQSSFKMCWQAQLQGRQQRWPCFFLYSVCDILCLCKTLSFYKK